MGRAAGGNGNPVGTGVRTLVLFDIDGTLLLSGGAGRAALGTALAAVYAETAAFEDYPLHGKTDPQIVLELLSAAGWDRAEIRRRMPSLWPVYLEALAGELDRRAGEGLEMVLPGVRQVLERLEGTDGVTLGLLTGNIAPAARMKLKAAGLATRFAVGAYGCDCEEREGIARIALARARGLPGLGGDGFRAVVVGDTPADVSAARTVAARAVAVATGRHSAAELAASGADEVFGDLSDWEAVVRSLVTGSGGGGGRAGRDGQAGTEPGR